MSPPRVQTPDASPRSPQTVTILHPYSTLLPARSPAGLLHRDLLLPHVKSLCAGGTPIPSLRGARPGGQTPGTNWPLRSPQLFHSFLFSCLSYFFLFFCLGILSTLAKEKN